MNSLIKKMYCDQQPTYVLIMDEYMKCIEYNKYMDEKIPALIRKMHKVHEMVYLFLLLLQICCIENTHKNFPMLLVFTRITFYNHSHLLLITNL